MRKLARYDAQVLDYNAFRWLATQRLAMILSVKRNKTCLRCHYVQHENSERDMSFNDTLVVKSYETIMMFHKIGCKDSEPDISFHTTLILKINKTGYDTS